jgi:hypothetical protein
MNMTTYHHNCTNGDNAELTSQDRTLIMRTMDALFRPFAPGTALYVFGGNADGNSLNLQLFFVKNRFENIADRRGLMKMSVLISGAYRFDCTDQSLQGTVGGEPASSHEVIEMQAVMTSICKERGLDWCDFAPAYQEILTRYNRP